jgi:hypothetical protein
MIRMNLIPKKEFYVEGVFYAMMRIAQVIEYQEE